MAVNKLQHLNEKKVKLMMPMHCNAMPMMMMMMMVKMEAMMMPMMINSHQTMEMGGEVVAAISLDVKQDHAHCVHLMIIDIIMIVKMVIGKIGKNLGKSTL